MPISKESSDKMALAAKKAGLRVHMDGARIFNASVALNTSVKDLTEHVDSATFCLSKGLSCPVGSIIVGEKDQIAEARRIRKLLGSAMRQVGVLAACCRQRLGCTSGEFFLAAGGILDAPAQFCLRHR